MWVGERTSVGIENEVVEVEIEVAGVEGELEPAEVENLLEVRIVVSCTIHSLSTGEHTSHRHGVAQHREVVHVFRQVKIMP